MTDDRSLATVVEVPAHETLVRIPKYMMQFFPEVNGG